jgi:hypothetical protein
VVGLTDDIVTIPRPTSRLHASNRIVAIRREVGEISRREAKPNRPFARFYRMQGTVTKIPSQDENKLGPGGWFAIVVLLGFLLAAVTYAVRAWTALDGVKISLAGWIFMGLGVVFTILVGGGLMALVFYSNRNNYDQ